MSNAIFRQIDPQLDDWFAQKTRKPLILRGARQVGKTFSVRALAKRQGVELIEVNFERRVDFLLPFEKNISAKQVILELEILLRKKIEVRKCMLFFDEIQICPRAIQSLRYFFEDCPDLHVVAAGSLLEFGLDSTPFPVGRVSFAWMYPLTFREFLAANGNEILVKCLPIFPKQPSTVPISAQPMLASALRTYTFVGGLPEAVATYLKTNSFAAVSQVLADLATSYLDDIRKYAKGDLQQDNTRRLLSTAFGFVGKQVNFTLMGEGDDIKRTKRSIDLLSQAMILHKVLKVSAAGLPLGASASEKQFKLVFLDIGLGMHLSGFDPAYILKQNTLTSVYEGKLAEQFVGQELMAESVVGSEQRNLYYWSRNAKNAEAEVDFVLARQGEIFPVEVKAGASGSLKSLHGYLKEHEGTGIVLQDRHDTAKHDRIEFWPIYTKI